MNNEELIDKIKLLNGKYDGFENLSTFPAHFEMMLMDFEEDYQGIMDFMFQQLDEVDNLSIPIDERAFYKLGVEQTLSINEFLEKERSKYKIIHCYFQPKFNELTFSIACEYITNRSMTEIVHFRKACHCAPFEHIFNYDKEYLKELRKNLNVRCGNGTNQFLYFMRYGISNVKYRAKREIG